MGPRFRGDDAGDESESPHGFNVLRVARMSAAICGTAPDVASLIRATGNRYCVFATCGGTAWVMKDVASSMAVPSGVGITMRNGTRIRVPTIGANAISILRWPARYLITGRSGI